MNRALVQVIAQVAVFLEFADEAVLTLDAAVKQQEDMAFQVQQLGPADRREFTRLLFEVADEWPTADGRHYLHALPRAFGLSQLSAGSLPGTDCEQSSWWEPRSPTTPRWRDLAGRCWHARPPAASTSTSQLSS